MAKGLAVDKIVARVYVSFSERFRRFSRSAGIIPSMTRTPLGNLPSFSKSPQVLFHLFTASELRSWFAESFHIDELRGLDVFHNRFAPDPRWNPSALVD